MQNNHNELFALSQEVWESIDFNEVTKTYADMKEMNLHKPPYDKFSVLINVKYIDKFNKYMSGEEDDYYGFLKDIAYLDIIQDPYMNLIVSYEMNKKNNLYVLQNLEHKDFLSSLTLVSQGYSTNYSDAILNNFEISTTPELQKHHLEWAQFLASSILVILLVTLATKNSIKEQKISKDLKRKIGKKFLKNNFSNYTTISVGKIYETMDSPNSGTPAYKVKTHLRRGHIRHQSYGPDRAYTKKIFIQPVFVNADENWISQRKAYVVKAS